MSNMLDNNFGERG